ncbi:sodium-coupled monocarboxylate transporter 1-like [Physella acuta]|uniref:sodium-coupled monocarboxylate transporter 1-like n=1 Tax=Physella acuta TaxID=109671 RepID=UPI0027DAF582|nr:sodium-coupled monocarboxylate transporter 1-like [Physella acuta]
MEVRPLIVLTSCISALAANTVEDILKKCLGRFRESRITFFTKLLVCFYGFVIVGLAYLANSLKGPVTQIGASVFGACGGPMFGVFILGACIPWSNKYGALGGGGLALVFNLWLAISGQMYGRKTRPLTPPPVDNCYTNNSMSLRNNSFTFENITKSYTVNNITHAKDVHSYGFFLYDISYVWYGFIGCFLAFISGAFISICFRNYDHTKPDPRLIVPMFRKSWSVLKHKPYPNDISGIYVSSKLEKLDSKLSVTTFISK